MGTDLIVREGTKNWAGSQNVGSIPLMAIPNMIKEQHFFLTKGGKNTCGRR